MNFNEIKEVYKEIKGRIEERLEEFREVWERGDDYELFSEFVFCLLTPQSKAGICWEAVLQLKKDGVLLSGSVYDIKERLRGVRFKNNKAEYIIHARDKFLKDGQFLIKKLLVEERDIFEIRDFLVKNVKGMGYKEASHFLRNIGFGKDFSILDRHILRNLYNFGIIKKKIKILSRKKYLEVEEKMRNFSYKIGIPLEHLDFVFWFKETGEIFK